jgi:hypothetical protein
VIKCGEKEMDKKVKICLDQICSKLDYFLDYDETPSRAKIEEIRSLLGKLEYLATPKHGWKRSPAPQIRDPICSEPKCKAGWEEGLINYAPAGRDPVWYCAEHRKDMEHTHHPPGTLYPEAPLLQRAEEMSKAWTRFLERMKQVPAATLPVTVDESLALLPEN